MLIAESLDSGKSRAIAPHNQISQDKEQTLITDVYAAVLKRLEDHSPQLLDPDYIPEPQPEPQVFPQAQPKKFKRRLTGDEFHVAVVSYWNDRPERESFIDAAMHWVVWAFLHIDDSRGKARTHELKGVSSNDFLKTALIASAGEMQRDPRCRVEMRPVVWWDVQERYHDVARNDIHMLAEEVHEDLLDEAIERLKVKDVIRYQHGYWILLSDKTRSYIQELKRPGRRRVAIVA